MYLLVAALIAGLLAGGVGTWKVQDWRHAAKDKARMEAEAEARRINAKAVDTAAVGFEADKGRIRTRTRTITKEVERVTQGEFYAAGQLCLNDDGLRQLRSAIAPAAVASEPARAVPRPRPAD
jgi:hypothetical protein